MDNQAENSRIFLLLLELISKFIFSEEGNTFIADMDEESIELLCQEAENNKLGILLYYYCGQDTILPESWLNKWSPEFRIMSANELRRAGELKSIYNILAENNIDAAPLKGAYLAYTYYPHPALRTMQDFDILIKPDNIKKAFQLMLDNGFTADYDLDNRCHEAQLTSPRGFVLELHTHIDHSFKRCDYESLWEGSNKSEFSGLPVIHLSPEIHLLHAINHAFKDNLSSGIKTFIDAAYILAGGDIDMKKLNNCAEKNGFHDEFTLFMNVFPEFFPKKYIPYFKDIPVDLIKRLRYLIYNFKHIQEIDYHQLMLHREYCGLSLAGKFLFLIKRTNVKPKIVAKTYNCPTRSPVLAFYYLYRFNVYFMKFISFLKTSKRNSLTRRLGTCQKMIDNYLKES